MGFLTGEKSLGWKIFPDRRRAFPLLIETASRRLQPEVSRPWAGLYSFLTPLGKGEDVSSLPVGLQRGPGDIVAVATLSLRSLACLLLLYGHVSDPIDRLNKDDQWQM